LWAQGNTGEIEATNLRSASVYGGISAKAEKMQKLISGQTARYLSQMAKQENLVEKALYQRDSLKAKTLFAGSQQRYQQLLTNLQTPSTGANLQKLKEYLPMVDSTHSALQFLSGKGTLTGGLSTSTFGAIVNANNHLQQLEGQWQEARVAEQFIQQRQQLLSGQLTNYGFGKNLLQLNKTAVYFQQQLAEYKSLLANKDKFQEKVLGSLRQTPAFQHFMEKNSYVGRLFQLPDNYGSVTSLPGLQTKDMIQERIGLIQGSSQATGGDPGQFLQQKVDNGQQQIAQLKTKLQSLGSFSGGGDMVMPEFQPNEQKTKTFWKRLEYSVSFQTQQQYGIMPATGSLGLSIGYKLSSKATIGVGGSYNFGLGQGISHLAFSSQGAGMRSFIDVKAKGSLWLTGGFEYNFVQGFSSWRDLGDWDQWQKSALFGLSKKFKLSANKNSNIQLLFDALYKQHTPASAPLVFRVGYSFN
jgi:hypothetical protein